MELKLDQEESNLEKIEKYAKNTKKLRRTFTGVKVPCAINLVRFIRF